MLEIMSKAVDFDINFKNFYGESALHRAVLGNSLESVKFLIEHGADINSVNSKDETPLNYAIRNADVLTWNKELNIPFIVEYLIKQGADLYRDNIDGINAIYIAAMVESLKMTKYLHEVCGMPINLPDKANLHCIHYAAMGENLKLIKYLIEKGVDINTLTGQRENALHLATGSQNNEIAEFLIKNGINYEQLNIKKETAIHIAYKTNNIFVFNLIMNDKLEKDKKARKKIMKSNLRNYYNAKTNKFNFY
jgi:ankyrin repeat protein